MIERVAERGVQVTLTDRARELLGNMGYDPTYGARPLRRVIQKQLTDRLALALLAGEIRAGDSVTVDAVDGELALEKVGTKRPSSGPPSPVPVRHRRSLVRDATGALADAIEAAMRTHPTACRAPSTGSRRYTVEDQLLPVKGRSRSDR